MKTNLTIAIIDDHTLFLKGMMHLIQASLPGTEVMTFKSPAALRLEKYRLKSMDLIICDIEIPGEDVFTFFDEIKQNHPSLPVLVISMHHKLAVIRQCKILRIEGYILKDEDELLLPAIRSILSGNSFYSPRVDSLNGQFDQLLGNLTRREKELIYFIAKGLSNKQISEKLSVCTETVKTHKKNIKLKLGIEGTNDIINFAKSNFLL